MEVAAKDLAGRSHTAIEKAQGDKQALSDMEIASAILRKEIEKAEERSARKSQLVLEVRRQVLSGRSIKDACSALGVERMTFYRILGESGLRSRMLFDVLRGPRRNSVKACPFCGSQTLVREVKNEIGRT